MTEKVKVFIARFPYGNQEAPSVTDWFAETVLKCKKDRRISAVMSEKYDDTPITMTRNKCLRDARRLGADVCVMIDSDMRPDLPLPGAKPFWDSSFDFWYHRRKQGPLVIAAPYCGPPPCENVYIFQWGRRQSDHPNVDLSLDQFSREDAAFRAGMEEVGALPTGLILIDMRALDALKPPYFQYEWTDETESEKASTEDVFFTRNVSLAGVPVYCNWDAWAGHWKRKLVGKPTVLTVEAVRKEMRDALLRGRSAHERDVVLPPLTEEQRREILDAVYSRDEGDSHVRPAADRHAGLDQQPDHRGVRADGRRPAGQEPVLAHEAARV